MAFATPQWDLALFRLANDTWRAPLLDTLMPAISGMALWVLLFAGIGGAALWRSRNTPRDDSRNGGNRSVMWRRGLALLLLMGLAAGITDAACNAIKKQAGRLRPLQTLAGVHMVVGGQWQITPADVTPTSSKGSSFVSSHAANSMAICLALMFAVPRLRPWLLTVPLLVGWSRLYLGKHYPTDVLAGWLLGLLLGYLAWVIWRAAMRRPRLAGTA